MSPRKEKEPCVVYGCNRYRFYSDGMCSMHSRRFKRTGRIGVPGVFKAEHGTGTYMQNGYVKLYIDGRQLAEHTYIAEQALGKRLPQGACIHHVDGNGYNNDPSNLVICPSAEYHKLLHRRARELGYE